jgi:hypothetical protein
MSSAQRPRVYVDIPRRTSVSASSSSSSTRISRQVYVELPARTPTTKNTPVSAKYPNLTRQPTKVFVEIPTYQSADMKENRAIAGGTPNPPPTSPLLKRKRAESNAVLSSDRTDSNIEQTASSKKRREVGNSLDVKLQKGRDANDTQKAGYCHQCNVKREPDGVLLVAVTLSG